MAQVNMCLRSQFKVAYLEFMRRRGASASAGAFSAPLATAVRRPHFLFRSVARAVLETVSYKSATTKLLENGMRYT